MSSRLYLKINELVVWSDNPRNGFMNDSTSLSEKDIINLLIDVVGDKKMFNLAEDIFNSGGLNGNVVPTVVLKKGKYLVYDGNRRISAIKMLMSPDIIESQRLKDKIVTLVDGKDLSFLNEVFVYETNEKEAIELMDKTHIGEQDGVGVIPWDAYNRDISLVKRNQNPKYPHSYKIAIVLGWKKKKDFSIPYTDFQRLFSSKTLINAFKIKALDDDNKDNIVTAVDALLLFKKQFNFSSFSRYFNITDSDDDTESTKPINTFVSWWQEQQKGKSTFVIRIDKKELFTDSVLNDDLSFIHIYERNKPDAELDYEKGDLNLSYIDPTGKAQKSFKQSVGGKWTIEVFYKGVSETGEILVRTPRDAPEVSFIDGLLFVKKGETLDLRTTIRYSKSIHDNNMALTSVKSVGEKDALLNDFILSSQNDVGAYTISYTFDNDGEEYSKNAEIRVVSNKNKLSGQAVEIPFEFMGNPNISFNSGVVELMKEINELWISGNYRFVVACSARAVAELSLDFIYQRNNNIFAMNDSFETKIIKLADYYLSNQNDLTLLSNKLAVSFHTTQNRLQNLKDNASGLNATVNLGAHKSATRIDSRDLFDKIRAYITLVVQIAEGMK